MSNKQFENTKKLPKTYKGMMERYDKKECPMCGIDNKRTKICLIEPTLLKGEFCFRKSVISVADNSLVSTHFYFSNGDICTAEELKNRDKPEEYPQEVDLT